MKIDASRRGILTGRWRKASNGIRPPWSGDESHFLTHCTRCDACINACETTFCNAARAAIRALISKITSAVSVTPARRLAPNRYFLRATPGPGICSSPLGTRAWRISQLNAAAVRIAVSQWQLSFARRSPGSTSRNLIANFARMWSMCSQLSVSAITAEYLHAH
ncbi:ferredoxin-type protein [Escherichia coli]|uniref:Ferredoxin-type protein n=1 Tax=Escherichia coli TaxID=562 RepID=A0A376Y638_ECOLX|nr:ferredoxin-type protein [Escherichia coli]